MTIDDDLAEARTLCALSETAAHLDDIVNCSPIGSPPYVVKADQLRQLALNEMHLILVNRALRREPKQ